MSSDEGREKVIQSVVIRDVDHRKLQRHVIRFSVKEVIHPQAGIEQVTRRDPRWIEVVISVPGFGMRTRRSDSLPLPTVTFGYR